MSDKITLIVRFRMKESAKREFTAKLQDIFTHIVKEETFVEASLVQDMQDPEILLNYEVWNESPESFMKNQMSKAYRAEFEKMIVDLKIDRTAAWYSTIADWTNSSAAGKIANGASSRSDRPAQSYDMRGGRGAPPKP